MNYTKPEIQDYGTLQELTEACTAPGGGDFVFPNTGFISTTIPGGPDSFCKSGGPTIP